LHVAAQLCSSAHFVCCMCLCNALDASPGVKMNAL
jgi:hypothetical protein